MKTGIKIIVIVALFNLSACSNTGTQQSYGPQAGVSLQLFYDQLSPYGMWVNYSPYGYVWMPDVGANFFPYSTAGNWVYTSYGWTWHSYYSWGWAPFHYGRWFYDSLYGWVWVPDTIWGPAWVIWSTGGGYCGWAPLAPNISVRVAVSGQYVVPRENWVFVREQNLSNRNVGRYRVNKSKNIALLENALLVREMREQNNVTIIPGPDRNTIQKALRKPITPVAIREQQNPGRGKLKRNELEIFKPRVERENGNVRRNAPERVFNLKDVRARNEHQYKSYPRGGGSFDRRNNAQRNEVLGKGNRGNSGKGKKKNN